VFGILSIIFTLYRYFLNIILYIYKVIPRIQSKEKSIETAYLGFTMSL